MSELIVLFSLEILVPMFKPSSHPMKIKVLKPFAQEDEKLLFIKPKSQFSNCIPKLQGRISKSSFSTFTIDIKHTFI